MFHACFIPIATCFASTLYHFYTFFGTNLLTRCRSASSCFLLFLYSRKASLEIFSELTKLHGGAYFSRTRLTERRSSRGGPPGGHTPPGRGPPFCRALGWCGPLGGPQPPPFRLLIPPDAKTLST
jgi:hypothetical protein